MQQFAQNYQSLCCVKKDADLKFNTENFQYASMNKQTQAINNGL